MSRKRAYGQDGFAASSRFAPCPCCSLRIPIHALNSHLDRCLSSQSDHLEPQAEVGSNSNCNISSKDDFQDKVDELGKCKLFPIFRASKKTVHLIRHGHTFFSNDVFDVRLSSLGIQQARALGPKLAKLEAEVILTSPLTRALETLEWSLKASKGEECKRLEVSALHSEHVACKGDVGRSPKVLASEFPWLSFASLDDIWWFSPKDAPNNPVVGTFQGRETIEHLRMRIGKFKEYLISRQERVLVIIGHSTFFKELTGRKHRMNHVEVLTIHL